MDFGARVWNLLRAQFLSVLIEHSLDRQSSGGRGFKPGSPLVLGTFRPSDSSGDRSRPNLGLLVFVIVAFRRSSLILVRLASIRDLRRFSLQTLA